MGGISWRAKTPLVFVNGTMNAVACTGVLQTTAVPFLEELYSNGLVFEQDGASGHTARHTKDF